MSTNPNIAALILRLSLGTIFLAHGAYLKLVIFGLAGTVGFFASLGLPGWFAYVVIAAEIAAGLGMILGVLTRWAALGMVPISLGAAWAHWGNGWTFSAPGEKLRTALMPASTTRSTTGCACGAGTAMTAMSKRSRCAMRLRSLTS